MMNKKGEEMFIIKAVATPDDLYELAKIAGCIEDGE